MTLAEKVKIIDILYKVEDECKRQREKWGEQNYPSLVQGSPETICNRYKIPYEMEAKHMLEDALDDNRLTWGHILLEEICEAFSTKNEEDLENELVQCAAVIVSWIDSIKRNKK